MPTPDARCRSCGSDDLEVFLSLGSTPLADALVRPAAAGEPEARYPLDVAVCPRCSLVQILHEVEPRELFVDNYLYFSSYSPQLLDHARRHADNLVAGRGLDARSLVVEVASNDGYLLRNFVERGIPVLGIDPAPEQAAAASAAGVPTLAEFFGGEMAARLRSAGLRADVIIANNVMAHVPDLNGFVAGIATLLADDGIATIENPSVGELIDRGAFDTIYHEHFCYFSCLSVDALVRRHGLFLNEVEQFPDLHGGTLRWTVSHDPAVGESARAMLDAERAAGLADPAHYRDFGTRVERTTRDLHALLAKLKAGGSTIAAYGAAAKGSTLLNTAGIGTDLVDFVVDRNPHKHGLLMPGVHVPIRPTDALVQDMPDYVLLLAWNFAAEIAAQQHEYLDRGGRFIVPVPTPTVI